MFCSALTSMNFIPCSVAHCSKVPKQEIKEVVLFRTGLQSAVPGNIHSHPKEGHRKFRGGGRGSQKPKILREI